MTENTKSLVQHIEWFAVLITMIGGFFLMMGRMDTLDQKIENQSTRTDRLYEMFIDLLKEKK